MKSILLLCFFTCLGALAQENIEIPLRVITIESQYDATDIILEDTDKTKIDLFYYYNTAYSNRHLVLPLGIKDTGHMLSLLQAQSTQVKSALDEAEQLKKDFGLNSIKRSDNFAELLAALAIHVAKFAHLRLFKPDISKKIQSIDTLKVKLKQLDAMKKLIEAPNV